MHFRGGLKFVGTHLLVLMRPVVGRERLLRQLFVDCRPHPLLLVRVMLVRSVPSVVILISLNSRSLDDLAIVVV